MFSEITHLQSQHHFPSLPNTLHSNACEALFSSTLTNPLAFPRPYTQVQYGSFRQRAEMPQHFTRPVRKTPIRSRAISSHTTPTTACQASEHLLRRKTPNGTLAAGYDGSPVEWSRKCYAMKTSHLPVSTTPGHIENAHETTRVQETEWSNHDGHGWHKGVEEPPHTHSIADESVKHGASYSTARFNGVSDQVWNSGAILPMGIDSVLNQSTLYHSGHIPAASQHIPTVLQPMWPPCLDATPLHKLASHDSHRPEEGLKPGDRGPPQDDSSRTQQGENYTDDVWAEGYYQNWLQDHHQVHSSTLFDNTLKTQRSDVQERTTSIFPALGESFSNGQNSNLHQRANGRSEMLFAYRRKPFEYDVQNPDSTYDRARLPVWESFEPSFTSSQHSYSPHNREFKDKIIEWARQVHGVLLVSIEQARRRPLEHNKPSVQQQTGYWPQRFQRHHAPTLHEQSTKGPSTADPNSSVRSSVSSPQHEHHNFSHSPWTYEGSLQTPPAPQTFASQPSVQNPNILAKHRRHAKRDGHPFSHHGSAQASYASVPLNPDLRAGNPFAAAVQAMEILGRLCEESGLRWTEAMQMIGNLAHGLGEYSVALDWYLKVLHQEPNNVETMSNMAATLLALHRRSDAEHYWFRSVKLKPSYFEATEHLVGLLHEGHRSREAVKVIDFVERSLRTENKVIFHGMKGEMCSEEKDWIGRSANIKTNTVIDYAYAIPPSENGRMLALIHGKGNMLYQLGDNAGAAQAFENAVLIGAGRVSCGIQGLIDKITSVFSEQAPLAHDKDRGVYAADEPILLTPDRALETSRLVFAPSGRLPGLTGIIDAYSQRAAVSIVSNSLLSLAKIYQDGMSSSGASANRSRATSGVQEILALYYLSLSLQPSPSTANNVGILLASVQQSGQPRSNGKASSLPAPSIPGVLPGSGIALALSYYDYGLQLDTRHAHLYTNLGSLFKDIGQLQAAIRMYEKAVECDGNFDIALANLANAVKDQGKVSDAIVYYRRAVTSNPDFAEAVCGLANALNSVCSWNGRGGIRSIGHDRDRWHVGESGELYDCRNPKTPGGGWIERVVTIVDKQLQDGESWGKGVLHNIGIHQMLRQLSHAYGSTTNSDIEDHLKSTLQQVADKPWEGARVVRLVERATKILMRRIYWHQYIDQTPIPAAHRLRPQLPAALAVPSAPTVLPFHTFTCPLSAKQIRKISQRNGLRVSCSTLRASWLPAQIYDPPSPPDPYLNVGYISSDFNNHPLAHLMQSVFGLHDSSRVKAFCYATTVSDGSVHRQQIEREAPVFHDASLWSIDRLVNQIVSDHIHILINLNGYTRGAKNEVFAARPAPIQMSFMGFAGTLGAEWCDYLLADRIAIPPQTLRPWRRNLDLVDHVYDDNYDSDEDWVYGENIIFAKDTFFCCDHRQSAPDSQEVQLSWEEELGRRWRMRKDLFPGLSDDAVILANFNQLYKVRIVHDKGIRYLLNLFHEDRTNYIQDMASYPLTDTKSCSLAPKISGTWRRKPQGYC